MAAKNRPKLDRFAAIKEMFANVDKIRNAEVGGIKGGASAALGYCAIWAHCDGRTGTVIMTVSRLARLIGSNRDTARRSLSILKKLGYIMPQTRDGRTLAGRWIVDHSTIGDGE